MVDTGLAEYEDTSFRFLQNMTPGWRLKGAKRNGLDLRLESIPRYGLEVP